VLRLPYGPQKRAWRQETRGQLANFGLNEPLSKLLTNLAKMWQN
jgi:hypothetical protein